MIVAAHSWHELFGARRSTPVGVLNPSMIGLTQWPATVAVQIHYSLDDLFRNQGWIDSFDVIVRNAGAEIE